MWQALSGDGQPLVTSPHLAQRSVAATWWRGQMLGGLLSGQELPAVGSVGSALEALGLGRAELQKGRGV